MKTLYGTAITVKPEAEITLILFFYDGGVYEMCMAARRTMNHPTASGVSGATN